MTYRFNPFTRKQDDIGDKSASFLGYYTDLTALEAAYSTSVIGSTANLGTTGTIWSFNGTIWVDTLVSSSVTSVNAQVGVVQLDTDDVPETLTPTNKYFTNERVDDRVSSLIQDGTGITWDYDDTANTLTPTVSLGDFSTTDLVEGTNKYYTDERSQDAVGGILDNTTTIDLTYTDGTPNITADLNSTLKTNYDTAYSHSQVTGNPHSTTKSDVGLGSVSNVAQMPLSYLDTNGTLVANSDSLVSSQKATKTYVDTSLTSKVSTSVTVNGHALSSNITVSASDVGLGSVENTALSTWTGTTNITTVGILTGPVKANDNIVVPKTSGKGIQVDTTSPTFPWRDMVGVLRPDTVGANSPTLGTFRGGQCREFSYSAGDKIDMDFHIPHNYVPGSDLYAHVHWSHNGTAISGNIVFTLSYTYAKGHNQAIFPVEKTTTITYNTTNIATTPRYIHRIDEIAITSTGGSASLIDNSIIEPDGIILMNLTVSTIPTITGGSPNEPFIFFVDLHYQSTGMGTKNKSPNFYS